MDVGSSSGMLLTNGLQWRDTSSLLSDDDDENERSSDGRY